SWLSRFWAYCARTRRISSSGVELTITFQFCQQATDAAYVARMGARSQVGLLAACRRGLSTTPARLSDTRIRRACGDSRPGRSCPEQGAAAVAQALGDATRPRGSR